MRIFYDMPARIERLPRDARGFPVPYFVEWIDGVPDFRVVSPEKWVAAVKFEKCWICGEKLGAHKAFVSGPMCGINRTSAEPPSHRDCALFAARYCPFLANPSAKRREQNLPVETVSPGGVMLKRNPGATLVWITKTFKVFRPPGGGALIEMGTPVEVLWYAEGRPATRAEVLRSIESGLPALEEVAATEAGGKEALHKAVENFRRLVPAN